MNTFKSYVIKYYLVLLGLFISTFYLWNRFIRERTVKDLPFNLTIIYFFILVYLCGIFAFILYTMFFKKGRNEIMEIILDWLFTPIKELEIFIRQHVIGFKNHTRIFKYLYPYFKYTIIETNAFYIIFWVFPRLLLLTALFIDVFIFHQFNYKYQVILFGLLLLFNRYFKYSLKNIKEEKINSLLFYVHSILVDYQPYIHPSELEPDYDPEEDDNDDWPPTMNLPLETYIKYNTESIVYENITRNILSCFASSKARDTFWEKYVGEKYISYAKDNTIPLDYKNRFGDKAPENYYVAFSFINKMLKNFTLKRIEEIMQISLLIEYLNKTSNLDSSIRKLKILIYLNYLLCWLYVLIISLPNLDLALLIVTLIQTFQEVLEPFSNSKIF
jgi:hypothetical protein